MGPNFDNKYRKLNDVRQHEVVRAGASKPKLNIKFKNNLDQAECCNKQGHWKRNCPQYLDDPNRLNRRNEQVVADQGCYMITPCNFSVCDTSTWVLDTGSPVHICNTLQGLQISRRFENNERFLNVGDGRSVPVLAMGIVQLILNTNIVSLNECHYCPSFLMNIISVGLLAKDGYHLSIKEDYCDIIMNDVTIMQGQQRNGIYILSQPVSVMYTSRKHPRLDIVSDIYLWHCRLGHINKNRINRLTQEGILEVSDCESLPTCESCLLGKMTKSPFTGKGERATELLGLVHTDVCGPMSTSARGGYFYFITFTDDLSRYGYVYLMKHKSDSFEMFKRFRSEVEK